MRVRVDPGACGGVNRETEEYRRGVAKLREWHRICALKRDKSIRPFVCRECGHMESFATQVFRRRSCGLCRSCYYELREKKYIENAKARAAQSQPKDLADEGQMELGVL